MTSRGLCERKCEKRSKSVTQGVRGQEDSGCVKVVVGWILVSHDGNGGLRSCDHRHGVSVKNGVKRGSKAECYLKEFLQYETPSAYTPYSTFSALHSRGGRGLVIEHHEIA